MLRRRFLTLLALLVLVLVIHPLALQSSPAHTLMRMLVTAVFTLAMWSIFETRRARTIGVALGVPVIIMRWLSDTHLALVHPAVTFTWHLLVFVFLIYAVVAILRAVYAESHLSREAIYGALCGFLLIGTAFGHLFYCVDWLAPADFEEDSRVSSELSEEHGKQALFMYFSFAALTGLSDSDMMPRAAAGRSLVLLEAVLGQFYVIIVLSELISLRISKTTEGAAES